MIYWLEDLRGSNISLPVEFLGVPDVGCNSIPNSEYVEKQPYKGNHRELKFRIILSIIKSVLIDCLGLSSLLNHGPNLFFMIILIF